jgi:hypothetical protein
MNLLARDRRLASEEGREGCTIVGRELDPNGPATEQSDEWIQQGNWGERRGLYPRPSVPQTDALPAELRSPLS